MASSTPPEADEALELVGWIDDIADRFEAAWRSGNPPRLEEFLEGVPEPYRPPLRVELEKIERAYRRELLSSDTEQQGVNQPKGDIPAVPGYEMLEELGRGGMGVVYKARQVNLPRVVALKIIPAEFACSRRQRFRAEGQAVARLRHANIVQLYEVGEHNGRPFFTMEFLEGGSLADRLGGQPLAPRQAATLVETLARAVQHAHEQSIVHRDLKPGNVLLEGGNHLPVEKWTPKISDFGLAKHLTEFPADGAAGYQTQIGEILGTPSYMAPEQAAGKLGQVGSAVDIYALGAILYELLTGRPPFRGHSTLDTLEQVRTQEPLQPSRLQPKMPRDVQTICLKALAKEPAGRYATAGALADDLRRFLDGRPIAARPVGRGEQLWRWCRRNPRVALLTVLAAASLLAGTSVSTVFLVQSQERAAEVRREQERVREQERKTARRRYLADMRLAPSYWEAARIGWLLDLLDKQRPEHTGGDDLRGFEWYYWHRRCYAMQILPDRTSGTHSVAYSPDGIRIAEVDGPTVRILDANTGHELYYLTGHTAHVSNVIVRADGKWLAVASDDDTLRVWDAQSGALIQTLKGGGCMAFQPDGRCLASASHDRTVRVWDLTDGREICKCVPRRPAQSLAFSPDGKRLAMGMVADQKAGNERAAAITVCDLATARAVMEFIGHEHDVNALAFSPDGKRLASASSDRTVRLWSATSGKEILVLGGHKDRVHAVAFSPDSRRLASGSADQTVRVWDLVSGKQLLILRGHTQLVQAVRFSSDGQQLASAALDGTVRVWDAVNGQEPLTLRGHQGEVNRVAFDPDGRWLATASDDTTVRLWDVRCGRTLRTLTGHAGQVLGVAFSPDGKWLATASDDRTGKVWDARTGREKFTLRGHTDKVWAMAYSPDGRRLASASEDKTVRLWGASDGREISTIPVGRVVSSVVFSPDGQRLITAAWGFGNSHDPNLQVWNVESGREVRTLRGHTASVWYAALSPDGRWLATASNDATVKRWDLASGEELRTCRGHTNNVSCVVFSPDGRRLASAGWDGTVKLWDVDSGEEVLTLKGHGERVFGVAFSPDGRRLASTNRNGTVQIWDATPPVGD